MSYIGNSPGNASQRVVTRKVATAGQTRFASDSGYATGYVDVIVNGSDLVAGVDFNETGDGINIDLVEACAADDNVKIVAYIPRGLSDGYTKPEANTLLALKADLVAGKIPSSQLPAYVDDVLEYANLAAFPATGSAGIIYVAQDTNNCYRWSGSAYIVLTDLSSYYTKTQSDAKYVGKDSDTGAAQLPSGTTAQRPATPVAGYTRYNTTLNIVETYHTADGWIALSNLFSAIGGVEAIVNGYKYHTFTTSGVFNVLNGTKTIEVLSVAGGGGGGSYNSAAGGGAGGAVQENLTVNSGNYSITIGAGGAGSAIGNSGSDSMSGSNTTMTSITAAIGGGRGGGNTGVRTGGNGGSGGGGTYDNMSAGSGTSGQGNAGGTSPYNSPNYPGGGGGGAGAVGQTCPSSSQAGAGGIGINWKSLGNYYAGGGGGSTQSGGTGGAGGTGGGGAGGGSNNSYIGYAGSANTGGGGGGGGYGGSTLNGGNGGSGIVIIRYPI